jgi:Tol biopolymer transport system component
MLAICLQLVGPLGAGAAPTARFYPQTGHWIAGDFLSFFDAHGGLDLFGYPRTEPMYGDGRLVQYFQRARFESWPENSPPYNVQLMLIGDAVMGPADPPVPAVSASGSDYFPQTGHSIAGAFRSFFDERGGLVVFGYPTSEAVPDSSGFVVQRFQRARFELHPELPPAYQISLGLLGDQYVFGMGRVPFSATLPVGGDSQPSAIPGNGIPASLGTGGQLVVQTSPGGNIVVENLDGTNAHIVGQGLDPAWSPDGKQIAFASWFGGDPGIFVVNADGSNLHNVYTMPFTRDPQWSPDGTRLSLYRRFDGAVLLNGVWEKDDWFQVMILNLATGTTALPPDQETHAYASTWSPDGQSLMFQQYDGLYVSKLTGPDLEPHLVRNTNGSFTTPSWSPDGKLIALTFWNHDHWDVGTIGPDGSSFRLLTYDQGAPAPSNNAAAAWSPRGDKIVFISDRSGDYTTYAMNPDGSDVTPLSGQPLAYSGAFARVLAWRP